MTETRSPTSPRDGAWWRRATRWAPLAVLLAVGALVRSLALAAMSEWPWFALPDVDSAIYDRMARAFAAGDYLIGSDVLRMSPAYPFLLGVVYLVLGAGPWPIRIVQLLLGLVTIGCTWDAARVTLGRRWAWFAGGAVAICGPLVFHEAQLLAEGAATAVASILLCWVCRLTTRRRFGWRPWLGAGAVLGVLTLLRPNALLLVIAVVYAAVCVARGRRAHRVIAVIGGLLLAQSPMWMRNVAAAGQLSLAAAHGGVAFYLGNGPGATGAMRVPREVADGGGPATMFVEFHRWAEREEGRELTAGEADRYWYGRTLRAIADDPVGWVGLLAKKLRLYWGAAELSDIVDYDFLRRNDATMGAPWLSFGLLAPLALVGCLLALWRGPPQRWVAGFAGVWCLGVVVMFVIDRYRVPALPASAILATSVLRVGWLHFRRRRLRRLGALAAAIVLAVVFAWWPSKQKDRDHIEWMRTGIGYHELGDLARAEHAYREALARSPLLVPAAHNLTRLYESTNRRARALEVMRSLERAATERGDEPALRQAQREIERLRPRP